MNTLVNKNEIIQNIIISIYFLLNETINIFTPVLIKMNSIIVIKFCHIDHAMIDLIILLLLDI